MPSALRWVFVLIAFNVSITGCNSSSKYVGDGSFLDNGSGSALRYELDLGSVDLSRSGERFFRFANLPDETFTFGLRIHGNNRDLEALKRSGTIVALRISTDNELEPVTYQNDIANWVWSIYSGHEEAFLYARMPGGTDFKLEPNRAYSASLTVRSKASAQSVVNARLIAFGGGWK